MIYVDEIRDWSVYGKTMKSCHMATDGDLEELHDFAAKLGLRRNWLHYSSIHPHYDLSKRYRERAIELGAIPVTSEELVKRCSYLFRGK